MANNVRLNAVRKPNDRRSLPERTVAQRNPSLSWEMVGLRLLKLTNLVAKPFLANIAHQHDITLTEWRTLVVLANHPGLAAQDIAEITGLHPMNISRAVAGLRRAGRIRDERDPENHRRSLLWLTKKGEETFRAIAPSSEAQQAFLLEPLTDDEVATLARVVDKLLARAEEYTAHMNWGKRSD